MTNHPPSPKTMLTIIIKKSQQSAKLGESENTITPKTPTPNNKHIEGRNLRETSG